MKKFLKKRVNLIVLINAIFIGVFLFNIRPTFASIPGIIIEGMLKQVFHILLSIADFFTGLIGKLFTAIIEFGWGSNMDMIYTGWTITRDIVNMLFILALVFIAFATILRLETYGIKQLLPKLIIIAILINFSYLACAVIIDASQTIGFYFLDLINTEDMGAGLLDLLNVSSSKNPSTTQFTETNPDVLEVINLAFAATISGVAGIVLLIGAVLLFIRVGALWALIILAPFAWFFGIFPALKNHASRWWSEFLKWTFFAPIYIFFIYLVVKIGQEIQRPNNDNIMGTPSTAMQELAMTEMASNWNLFFIYVFLVILLFGAPMIAMSMGIRAAGTVKASVVSGVKKGAGLPWKGIRSGAKSLGQKFDRSVLAPAGLSATTMKRAWKERKARKEKEAYEPATAKWRDRFNKVMSLGKERTFHGQRSKDLEIDKERQSLKKQGLSPEALADRAYKYKSSGNMTGFKAATLEAISSGGAKSLFEHKELGDKYNNKATPENLQQLIKDSIKNKEDQIGFASKIESAAKAKGDYQFTKLTKYDPSQGKTTWTSKAEARDEVVKSVMGMPVKKRWQELDKSAFLTEDSKGNIEVTDILKKILREISKQDTLIAHKEMPVANIKYIESGQADIQREINSISDANQKRNAQDWLNNLMQEL